MRTYDITLTISPDLVVWPGDPAVELERVDKIEEGANANVSRINMGVHTGTHVDAPFHFLEKGNTVEHLDLKMLTGRAYVLHVKDDVDLITPELLEKSDIPPRTRRVLFRTRNSELWAKGHKKFKEDFVAISPEAAEYLINKGVKLVGVDYLSVAPYKNSTPTHQVFLKAEVVIVEGLNLSEVSQGRYTLYCLPLKIANTEGAPARAILVGV